MTKLRLSGLAAALFLSGLGAAEAEPAMPHMIFAQGETAKIFQGVGKITRLDASEGLASIDHEAIPGLMDAMEMQYEVKPAKLLEGLQVGDKVEFTVDGKTLTILSIRKAATK